MAEDGKIKNDSLMVMILVFLEDEIEELFALGVVRISLAKNIAYNVVKEKTKYDLIKALSSILMSVDIKFDDEVQALLLLFSLPESWSGTVTAEDIRRVLELFVKCIRQRQGRKQDKGQKQNRGLKRRLISVEQLDEEGYHVGFGDQKWKVLSYPIGTEAIGTRVEKGMKIVASKMREWQGEGKFVSAHTKRDLGVTLLYGEICYKRFDKMQVMKILYGAKAATDSSNLTKPNQKGQVSPGGSLDMSEGSKNNRSFEDSGRSDKEDSKDEASSEVGGSETPHRAGSRRCAMDSGSPSIILLCYFADDMLVAGFSHSRDQEAQEKLSLRIRDEGL
ncbi:hypothetical protein Tco_0116574 [Tanacetum coccineum]